jgi:hypothetical protein
MSSAEIDVESSIPQDEYTRKRVSQTEEVAEIYRAGSFTDTECATAMRSIWYTDRPLEAARRLDLDQLIIPRNRNFLIVLKTLADQEIRAIFTRTEVGEIAFASEREKRTLTAEDTWDLVPNFLGGLNKELASQQLFMDTDAAEAAKINRPALYWLNY